MPKLVITEDGGTREVGLKTGDTLGRTAQNAVQLKVAEASRQHCRFTLEKNSWFVEDLGSSNGTQVNGRKVSKFELQDGDVIQVGVVTLKFLESEPESGADDTSQKSWGDDDLSLEDKVFLVLGQESRLGEVIPLNEGRLTIGRNMKHALVLKDASISGDHAELQVLGTSCRVKDLGSSNGTFVNGKRVTESDLASGDTLRLGTIDCVFGVGDPKDFAPPAKSGTSAGSEDFTRAMEVSDFGEDATFELHTVPAKKETVWNLLAALLVVGLLAGAGWLVFFRGQGESGGRGRTVDRGANLLPELAWSFEVAEGETTVDIPTWSKLNFEDSSEASEVTSPVSSGYFAYRIQRGDPAATPTLVVLDAPIVVSPGRAYRLKAEVAGDGAVPILAALWSVAAKEGEEASLEVARDLLMGLESEGGFQSLGDVVFAPDGATQLKVAVGAQGSGSVVFDDVVLESVDTPAGRICEVSGFRAFLKASGTLRLSRFGRRVLDGVGVAATDGTKSIDQESLFVADPSVAGPGAVQGSLRGGRGMLATKLVSGTEEIIFGLRGPALKAAGSVVIPLFAREGADLQVTLFDGEKAQGYSQDFSELPATALIVGAGIDRVKLHLQDAAGAVIRLPVSAKMQGGAGVVSLSTRDLDEVSIKVQLTFQREEQEARELLTKAASAGREGRTGEAILVCDDLLARFPFEPKVLEDVNGLKTSILTEGRKRLETLRLRVDDSVFFRNLSRDAALRQEIAEAGAKFDGTALGVEFAGLAQKFDGELKAWLAPRLETEATRILARGKDYMDAGKRPLAALFFSAVVSRFSGSDEAQQASGLMQQLERQKNDGGRQR